MTDTQTVGHRYRDDYPLPDGWDRDELLRPLREALAKKCAEWQGDETIVLSDHFKGAWDVYTYGCGIMQPEPASPFPPCLWAVIYRSTVPDRPRPYWRAKMGINLWGRLLEDVRPEVAREVFMGEVQRMARVVGREIPEKITT